MKTSNQLVADFNKGIKLAFIGVSNSIEPISDIKEVIGGLSISCDGGQYFTVSSDKIYYLNTLSPCTP